MSEKELMTTRMWMGSLALGTLLVMAAATAPAIAQEYLETGVTAETVTMSTTTLDSLMKRIDALEAKLDDTKKQEAAKADEWKDVSAEKWTFKFGGRVMADYVMFADQDAGNQARFGDIPNYFEWRRIRLRSEGEGYGVYFYRVELEFEPEGELGVLDSGIALRDVYFGIKEVPGLGTVYVGNVKQPISLEIQMSSNYLTFTERSLPRMFLQEERFDGIRASNHIPSEAVIWDYGVFFGRPIDEDHEFDTDNQGVRVVGRMVTTPYYCEGARHLVHLGVGGAWQSGGEDRWRWRTRPEVHEGVYFLDTGNFDSDSISTLNFESAVNWGPCSLISELYYNRNQAVGDDIDLYGGYAEVSWFLTGESRPYDRAKGVFDRLKPYTNFWLVRGRDGVDAGWGAWQLAARWSAVDLSDAAFTGANRGLEHDMTLGVNWYWNPNIRWMVDWIHAWNAYDQAVGGYTDGQADILAIRGQVDF
jgi:phosphate-selective porin OprO and OprP